MDSVAASVKERLRDANVEVRHAAMSALRSWLLSLPPVRQRALANLDRRGASITGSRCRLCRAPSKRGARRSWHSRQRQGAAQREPSGTLTRVWDRRTFARPRSGRTTRRTHGAMARCWPSPRSVRAAASAPFRPLTLCVGPPPHSSHAAVRRACVAARAARGPERALPGSRPRRQEVCACGPGR